MRKKITRKSDRGKLLTDNAFREVNSYPPERVQVVERKFGKKAANKMKAAIALSQARKLGIKT